MYDFLRRVYSSLWFVAIVVFKCIAVFSPKFDGWLKGRRQAEKTLLTHRFRENELTVWLHSSSLGEYEQGKPVLQKLRNQYPGINIVVTFFSSSGYDIVIKDKLPDLVLYLPFDTIGKSRFFLDRIRPDLGIFVKYDVWPNVILEAGKRGIKLYLIAALIKEKSFYLKNTSLFFKKAYLVFDTIYAQNQKSKELLLTHGFRSVKVAGDPRIDRVREIAALPYKNEKLEKWIDGKRIFTFGSNHSGQDDDLTVEVIRKINEEFPGEFKFLIFPHHIDTDRVKELRQKLPLPCSLYTDNKPDDLHHVLIVNTIGMLSLSYRYAEMVYIGGGFDGAVHNLLEPAAYYLPLFSGPGMGNFLESVYFRNQGILHVFSDPVSAQHFSFAAYIKRKKHITGELELFFKENAGGTDKIFRDISEGVTMITRK